MMTSDITAATTTKIAVDRQKFVAENEIAILSILWQLINNYNFSTGFQ